MTLKGSYTGSSIKLPQAKSAVATARDQHIATGLNKLRLGSQLRPLWENVVDIKCSVVTFQTGEGVGKVNPGSQCLTSPE